MYQGMVGLCSGPRQEVPSQEKYDKDASTAIALGVFGGKGMMEMKKENFIISLN
mgnify:CR=1 FL=1